jgi:sterol desaturase/sphingolipid hydroxylase (fatty acid hydroxylase superfamily)
LQNQATIRIVIFLSVLIIMAIWESFAPRRVRVANRGRRSLNNLLLVVIGSLLVRLFPILSAISAADWAGRNRVGVFNWIEAPGWVEILFTLILLDLLIYGQHVATHRLPVLWRFHQVHHTDLDLDAASGVRFHPVELLLSMVVKMVAVTILGARLEAVMLFEIVLNATSLFNHANVFLPEWCDRCLRWIIVTPDMHRIHHSIRRKEMHSNFGFNLPFWDRIFHTYHAQPAEMQEHLTLGLPELRTEEQTVPVWALLIMPFRRTRKTDLSSSIESEFGSSRDA